MQTGQYGVPEVPAYVVGRGPPAHMFGLSHEMSLASPTPHPHHQHAQHHHLAQQQVAQQQQQQQQQQQVQQAQQQQQHHPHHHPQHQQGHPAQPPQAPQHQQQQQVPPSHHQAQHPQQQQHNQAQQQQQQQHQQVQQQVQQSQQQQMVQQLGLAGPDSPEEPSPIASRPSPTGFKQLVQGRESLGEEEAGPDEGDRGAGGNRWPRQETLALIKIRSEMDANFRDSGLKGPLWEDVSRKLAELGYHRSSKKCKEKFENVHKYYKKTKDGRAGRQDGKSYRFFSQLEALYGGSGQGGGGGGGTPGGIGGAGGGVAVASVNHNVPPEPLLLTGGPGSVTTVGGGVGLAGAVEGLVSAQRHTENSSGVNLTDDSDEDYDEPGGDGEDHDNKKKRKRKDWKPGSPRSVSFFENLVKKLMDKQEAMQRKFLEALERREQERLLREDAWRRQEMARQTREFELRSQEHAMSATRDAALVAYLQKVTGQTFNLPQLPQLAPPVPIISMAAVPEPVADEQHQQQQQQAPQQAQQQQHAQDEKSFDPNSKRWPKPEVLHLIRLRSGLESKFQEAGPKGPLWDEISAGMTCMGYSRSSKRCKEKWENINKYFRKTKESNKKRPENAKTCPYFHQLDNLYRKGLLGNPNSKQLQNKVEEHSDELLDPQQQPGGSSRDADSGSYIESDSLFKVGLTM